MVTMIQCFWVEYLDLLPFSVLIRYTSPGPAVQDLLKLLPSASAHHYEPAHARKTPCNSVTGAFGTLIQNVKPSEHTRSKFLCRMEVALFHLHKDNPSLQAKTKTSPPGC